MSKPELSEAERMRRPAARRNTEGAPQTEGPPAPQGDQTEPKKRIRARRAPKAPAAASNVPAAASGSPRADSVSGAATVLNAGRVLSARTGVVTGPATRVSASAMNRSSARAGAEVKAGPTAAEPTSQASHASHTSVDSPLPLVQAPRKDGANDVEPPQPLASYPRQSTALAVHTHAVDEFGLDPAYDRKLRPFFERIVNSYLHLTVEGAERIPATGRVLLVSNHSRSLSWDGIVLRTALRLHHPAAREARWLVDDAQYHAPFLGTFINRLGAVRACQENAERLLLRDELVATFPEGFKGSEKSFRDRYRLLRFGRGGYVKLALRTGAQVLPVAIVGDEESNPWFQRAKALSELPGLSLLRWTPGLPRLGAFGVPPLPSRWRIAVGEPIREIARQDVDATRDEGLIHELNECVRGAVQRLIDQTRAID